MLHSDSNVINNPLLSLFWKMILVEVWKFTYKIVLVSTVLTDVKTCFVILVGILIIHSPTVFIDINIFLSDPALIKTPAY